MKDNKKQQKISKYTRENPNKAIIIQKAVKKGVKEYEETFRRLASS